MTERIEMILDRYRDAVTRIREIPLENTVQSPFREYFCAAAEFIGRLDDFIRSFMDDDLLTTDRMPELIRQNQLLYGDLVRDYAHSWMNPSFAEVKLGGVQKELTALYGEIRGLVPDAFEKRYESITVVLETFIQLYCIFTGEELPSEQEIRSVLYSYAYDYSEDMVRASMQEQYDPEESTHLLKRIVLQGSLLNNEYLYRTGEYVSKEALETAAFAAKLPEDIVDRMAYTWYRGYRDGFILQGKPYSKKSIAEFRFDAGWERVVRRTAEYLAADGYDFTVPRHASRFLTRNPAGAAGYYISPNQQMDYDHAYDLQLVMGDRIVSRMLEERNQCFEEMRPEISRYAGPIVMECFGGPEFEPAHHPANPVFTEHQSEAYGEYRNSLQVLTHKYIHEEERSFTIISWPLPSIGPDFRDIFRETLEINTMDPDTYRPVQEKLIAALDQAVYVEVTGRGNDTHMKVMLHPLRDPERQSNFENCLADVNIPLGEVFTSPVLTGTEGLLHVQSVYINGIRFRNLKIRFEDGRVTEYGCDNGNTPEEGRALIRKAIFMEKEHLPLGEFAIGTNTRAYRMMEQYDIGARMPILISEKTGPHFAVGDTCYSFMEDMKLYNPDGKELIAKENECSALRQKDPEKAYFAVHTDITISYRELDKIEAVRQDGSRITVISNGRFVLPGTEVLNAPLDA